MHQLLGSSESGSHIRGGAGYDFVFGELRVGLSAAVRRGRGRGTGLYVREEEFALFELRAVGVAFGSDLGSSKLRS